MEPAKLLTGDLPTDALSLVLYQLQLAHDIARTAPTSRVISVAVRNAFKLRPFSTEVVTLAGPPCVRHRGRLRAVGRVPPGGRRQAGAQNAL